ncbi:hypothetical protein KFU94_09045 [Chloroflexi bacterium TSY]|nr:hypothetical protein [Chloroflexi bacterium TSY]
MKEYKSDVYVTQEAAKIPPPPLWQRALTVLAVAVVIISILGWCSRRISTVEPEPGPNSVEAITEDATDILRDTHKTLTLEPNSYSERVYRVKGRRAVPICSDGQTSHTEPLEGAQAVWLNNCPAGPLTRPGREE